MYNDARRYPFNGDSHPGLDVGHETIYMHNGYNVLAGRFKVCELVLNKAHQLTQFAVDFEEHCDFSPAVLYGSLRFHSNVPVIANPAAFVEGNLVLPLVEAILPANQRIDSDLLIPAAFDSVEKSFIVPSVIKKTENGIIEEYELRFSDLNYDLKVGDILTLEELKRL